MSEPVSSSIDAKIEHKLPPIEDARKALISFLEKMPDVRQVNITKLVALDTEKGTWEAEADVYVPNQTIKTLGLPVKKEVLDCQPYLLRLDNRLNVIAYGLRDTVET